MNETEKACIEWSKKVGVVCEPDDPNAIHFWRAQFIKLLQEANDLLTEVLKDNLDKVELEAGDCLFVLNNLKYIAGDKLELNRNSRLQTKKKPWNQR